MKDEKLSRIHPVQLSGPFHSWTKMPLANIHVPRHGRGLQASMEKYWAIFQVSIANNLAYIAERLVRTISLVLIIFIFVQLWRVTYSGTGTKLIGGFSLEQMIWYLVLTEAIALAQTNVNVKIDEDVRSGTLAYALSRPYNYVLYQYTSNIGEFLLNFTVNLVVGGMVALVLVGMIAFDPFSVLVAGGAVMLALTFAVLSAVAIGLLAFWMEDTRSVWLVFSRFMMIMGGLLMPLEVFPEPLASISRALPFSSMFYVPGRFFVTRLEPGALASLGLQVLWVGIFAVLAAFIYLKGVRRVESNGG